MCTFHDDSQMISLVREQLYTAVLGDIMDGLGYYNQILPPTIKAMLPGQKIVGRAMTVLMMDVFGPQSQPFGRLTQALDQIQSGEVYICTGGTYRCAYWGELLTTTAQMRGGVGAIIDGYHRDTRQIQGLNWPVFSKGSFAQDSGVRTKVVDYRCKIEIGGVTIDDGDLLIGDEDGVAVIPKAAEREVIEKALEKVNGEHAFIEAIRQGMCSTQAFEKFGVL